MNRRQLEAAVRQFLDALGEPGRPPELEKTPARVAQAWAEELLAGYGTDPLEQLQWEPAEGDHGLVAIRDIDFQSVCLHHLLPFTGQASIAYLPDRRLAGLSKFPRLVDCLSRRLQLQERLTHQILDTIQQVLQPRGAACLLVAEHQCMSCRGVRRPSARVATVAVRGDCSVPSLRAEVMSLLDPSSGR
jgi:GTP cyclohydrolase I